ncbi:unnamed protein product [Rotaria sordida]|uniref:Receptor protein-tyrosine kinase n=1 Tax=Rotaria sordida TaxID=392033 RepID=A0A813ULK4_9BILA|nr:unnamed protein product [Rotaria sordida]CAF0824387.1 unnamed protein product [Rotaria sordida]
MLINLSAFILLLVELLSLGDLSSTNNDDNQYQVQITHIFVNQPTSSTILNTLSTNMQWIKTLKNITEDRGQTVLLECQVKSLYPVSFNWYRYNNPIDKNSFNIEENFFQSSIRLKNLKESQTGFYTCEVSNGLQTLTSTGFVRVKNSDFDSIDLNDDLSPFIEFQPEIIINNDELIEKLKCELYKGNICRLIIGSNNIAVGTLNQKEIERNLIENIQFLSNECRQLLLPMICFFVYPICDKNQITVRSICRKSCYYFQNNNCMREMFKQPEPYSNFRVSYTIPTCENLPPSSEDVSCIKVDQYRNVSSFTSISSISGDSSSSSNYLQILFLKIIITVALICILILFFYCCYRNRKKKNHLSSSSIVSTPRIKPSCLVNPIPSSPIIIKQNHYHHQHIKSSSSPITNIKLPSLHHRQTLLQPESNYQETYLPLSGNTIYEIPMTNIRFLQEIGQGEFGRIYIGELIESNNKCIIKTLENEHNKQDYLREIEIFRHIHQINLSCLIGICISSQYSYPLIIYEYLNHGNLHEYLILQSSKNINLKDFLFISIQIVSGMIYLSEKKFLHNDLSAKNILLCEHLNIKITNIGRYQRKYHLDYYNIANHSLPVRWMSIESLLSGIYSEMSDVWSFGVLLWEMFSYGTQPYYGYTNPEVIEMIRDRILLVCPLNCSKKIYVLMCSCWEEISEQRPTFIELMQRLKQLQEKTTLLSIDDELESSNQLESFREKL